MSAWLLLKTKERRTSEEEREKDKGTNTLERMYKDNLKVDST